MICLSVAAIIYLCSRFDPVLSDSRVAVAILQRDNEA